MAETPFLTARWQDLLLVTYAVPDALLTPRLPPGLALDRWAGDALVSLVAFDFLDTRVLGVPWPGFVNFPELNLRFYVREIDSDRRGVCFVREYVPSAFISGIARALYNEPYVGADYVKEGADHVLRVGGRSHRVAWRAAGDLEIAPEGGMRHFLKEHEWGYGVTRRGARLNYRVEHPPWRTWASVTPALDVDFGMLYGDEWAFLNETTPRSAILAEGSEVAVFKPSR
jgi:hypothetical protein